MSFRDLALTWTDERIAALLAAPAMWGSAEAVEFQALLLFEFRTLILQPTLATASPHAVADLYTRHLSRKFGKLILGPLHQVEGAELIPILTEFGNALGHRFHPENPFERADIAVRMRFKPDRKPTLASVTGYCDDVRRVARAVARTGGKTQGRVRKDIEAVTEFTVEDVRISPLNGSPAEATVLLEKGKTPDQATVPFFPDAVDEVRGTYVMFASLADWLAADVSPSEAPPIEDAETRAKYVAQMLRLVPRRDVAEVELGGQLLARQLKPVTIRPEYAGRCYKLLSADAEAEPFEETREIRSIDLDRGVITLAIHGSRKRLTCYLESDLWEEVREVGVTANIKGELYRMPFGGSPFLIARSVEQLEGHEGAD